MALALGLSIWTREARWSLPLPLPSLAFSPSDKMANLQLCLAQQVKAGFDYDYTST